MRRLYRVTEGRAVYGLIADQGVVTECAAYGAKRFLGRRIEEVEAAVDRLDDLGPDPIIVQEAQRLARHYRDKNRGETGG